MKRLPNGVRPECLRCGYYITDKGFSKCKCYTPDCPAYKRDKLNKGSKKNFKVMRIWHVKANNVQDAINKSKNWAHDEIEASITINEPTKKIVKVGTLPRVLVLPGYTPEREYTAGVKVWSDKGKLFVRIPVDGDHPLQVEIDTLEKMYDVYGYD